MSIHLRYDLGRLLRKCGYRITANTDGKRSTETSYFQGFLFFGLVLNWFFDADVQPAMINFENLHLGRRERSASRELLRTNGYWWIETFQDTFAIKEFLARP
jgi:hypothetical protein